MGTENGSQPTERLKPNTADVIDFAAGTAQSAPTGSRRHVWIGAAISLVVLIALGLGMGLLGSEPGSAAQRAVAGMADVQTRTLEMKVLGRGTVQPARVAPIRSPIESNRARIVWLLAEGEQVAAGELVARLDKRPFAEALELALSRQREARAQVVRAEKALALAEEDAAGKRESAARSVEVAEIDVEDVREGSGRIELRRLQAAVDKAARALRITEVEQADYASLFDQGHISRKELEVAQDTRRNAADTLELNRKELEGYERFTWPKRIREADLKLDAAQAELARVERTATLDRQRLEADLAQVTQDANVASQMVQRAQTELEQAEVRSPIAGTLLYGEVPKNGERHKVQVGDAVWQGQTILEIPDTSDLEVHLMVRELDVAKLSAGLAAHIELDAFRGRSWPGVVTRVSNMASDGADESGQFLVEVRFNKPPDGVHVGMSANVGIVYERHEAERAVPTTALRYESGQAMVRLHDGHDGWHEQAVRTGTSDGIWVEVLEGLGAGDRVAVY